MLGYNCFVQQSAMDVRNRNRRLKKLLFRRNNFYPDLRIITNVTKIFVQVILSTSFTKAQNLDFVENSVVLQALV